jgi:hypothetical protein
MPIIYSQSAINARLQGVVSTIDAGAGNGTMSILTSSSALAANITLAKPSGTVAGGVLTFTTPLSGTTLANGNATFANIQDSNGNPVITGLTVGISTSFDVVMNNTAVNTGQIIALTSAIIIGS